jgi:flagellar biosynthesis anti-sigma factor FlgM
MDQRDQRQRNRQGSSTTVGTSPAEAGSAVPSSPTAPKVGRRAGKVARIRKAIEEGRYEVSPSAVAGKLIDHMRRQ